MVLIFELMFFQTLSEEGKTISKIELNVLINILLFNP